MQFHYGLGGWVSASAGLRSVVCIGAFDGVHRGHQTLLAATSREARARAVPAVVVTFDRHPEEIVAPERAPDYLATPDDNRVAFAAAGIDATVVLPFDETFRQQTAETFFQDVLCDALGADALVVGHDFRFGRGREGSAAWLAQRLPTEIIQPVAEAGDRISSTRIRSLVQAGDVEAASRLLGRPYRYTGFVGHGQKLGRQLGFPTANLVPPIRLVTPGNGIYAAVAHTPRGVYRAAVSVGTRPTVDGEGRTVEAYLLDYPGESLYGRSISLDFFARIRNEERFDTLDALVQQMHRDVEAIRTHLRD